MIKQMGDIIIKSKSTILYGTPILMSYHMKSFSKLPQLCIEARWLPRGQRYWKRTSSILNFFDQVGKMNYWLSPRNFWQPLGDHWSYECIEQDLSPACSKCHWLSRQHVLMCSLLISFFFSNLELTFGTYGIYRSQHEII